VANYLHQRYGALDEEGRTVTMRLQSQDENGGSGSGISGSSSGHAGVTPTEIHVSDQEDKAVHVPTLATREASSIQHGQEAPLLLGEY